MQNNNSTVAGAPMINCDLGPRRNIRFDTGTMQMRSYAEECPVVIKLR